MALFKKKKPEKVALNLINPENQRAALQASLDHKIPLLNLGDGVFLVDTTNARDRNIKGFFEQFLENSTNSNQGVIWREDPKYDFLIIFDREKEE